MSNYDRKPFNTYVVFAITILVPLLLIVSLSSHGSATPISALSENVTAAPSDDTYVASGKPNEQWATLKTIWVGSNQADGFGIQRSLLRFDLSAIPQGSTIQSAELTLTVAATTPNDDNANITVRRVNGSWAETVTWNQHDASLTPDPEHAQSQSVSTALNQNVTWRIQELVQKWANESGRPSSLSLFVTSDANSGQHDRAFWSKNCNPSECGANAPKLVVEYTEPPKPTPTPALALTLTHELDNVKGTAVLPANAVTFTIDYKNNGSEPLEGITISATIPSGFEVIAKTGGRVVNDAVVWERLALAATQTDLRTYTIERKTLVPLRFDPFVPQQVKPYEEIPFNLPPNVPDGSCYKWHMGDGTIYESHTKGITYFYAEPGTYQFKLLISNVAAGYYAAANIPITVTGVSQSPKDPIVFDLSKPCTAVDGQDVVAKATVKWPDGDAESNTLWLKPSSISFLPIVKMQSQSTLQ